jgi:hypothetical protein
MLYGWLATQEGFSIKWQHVSRKFLNNLKTSFETTIKQKSESKRDEFGNFGKFF